MDSSLESSSLTSSQIEDDTQRITDASDKIEFSTSTKYLIFSFSNNLTGRWANRDSILQTPKGERIVAYRNLVSSCFSFVACFGSYVSILSLQSSINSEDGLGLASSAIIYAFFIISALSIAPGVAKVLGSKYTLIFGYTLMLLYTLLNFYPSWYTLIPGAIINGIGQPHIWIAIYKHAQTVAIRYAPALKETIAHALFLFAGYVAMSVKIAYIFGSLMVSSILFTAEAVEDDDLQLNVSNSSSSSDTCTSTGSSIETNAVYYILISSYTLVGLLGITVALLFMDHFKTTPANEAGLTESTPLLLDKQKGTLPKRTCQSVTVALFQYMYINVFLAILEVIKDWRMLLIVPMCILNGLKLGFIIGIFTQVYIKECVGIQWIGFVVAVYGVGGTIMAYTTGRIVKYIRQFFLVYSAFVVSLGLLGFLLFWERKPSLPFVFIFCFVWVLAESIYNATIPGLIGQWYQNEKKHLKDAAIGIFQVCLSVGFIVSFIGGIYFTTAIQLWIIVAFVIISAIAYTVEIELGDK